MNSVTYAQHVMESKDMCSILGVLIATEIDQFNYWLTIFGIYIKNINIITGFLL